jgi:translation initiation factor 2B subunit (eIF-2B alpha/beta/delta family)
LTSSTSFFEPVIKDYQSGSSRILDQVIWASGKTMKELQWDHYPTEILLDELEKVQCHHSDLVIIRHFVLEIKQIIKDQGPCLTKNSILSWIDDYRGKWRNANNNIAKNFLQICPVDRMKMLFHSHSGTLVELGREIFSHKINVEIFQTESIPGAEGKIQAVELRNIGLNVDLVADAEIPEVLGKINIVLFGADQISKNSWLNKMGTRKLSELAHQMKIPVWVLADSRKKVDKIKISNPIFEETDLGLLTGLITENVKV